MDISRFYYLFTLYKNNSIQQKEWEELAAMIKSGQYDAHLEDVFLIALERKVVNEKWTPELEELMWKGIRSSIRTASFNYRKWLGVAAAVTAITLGVWFFNHPAVFQDTNAVAIKNDIRPGRNTATLTLANGETINLSDAKTGVVIGDKLTYNDKSEIASSLRFPRNDGVEMLTASTPRGGTYQVVLPDGTKAWLNADSKITFPSQFLESKREVSIAGEIYFEVAKGNKPIPFIIKSPGQTIEVLGTHFNVSAYPDEGNVKTTLIEGSVRVSSSHSSSILKPGQQASLNSTKGEIKVEEANLARAVAWKNGKFIFDDEPLESIMKKISRWYNVEIEYRGVDTSERFWGSLSRFETISAALDKLAMTEKVHFKLEGRKIIVTK